MATGTDTTAPLTPGEVAPKHQKRQLRKLEKRLTTVRTVEAKRTRQAEKAATKGAAKLAAKRGHQLEKAARRSGALEALITELRALVPLASGSSKSNGSRKPKAVEPQAPKSQASRSQAAKPAVLRAFCLRERKTVEMQDPKPMVMSNGRSATVGRCPSCGVRVIRPG